MFVVFQFAKDCDESPEDGEKKVHKLLKETQKNTTVRNAKSNIKRKRMHENQIVQNDKLC